jgi:hypothetical protein
MLNQIPSPFFLEMPSTSMPSGSQIPSHRQQDPQTRVQLDIGQAYMYQMNRGASFSGQTSFDLHHRAPSVNETNAYAPLGGEPHSFPPGHSVR